MPDYQHDYPKISEHNLQGADGNPYFADADLIAAANAAYELERPLLLTGEAGCGKTDFGFAVARNLTEGRIEEVYVRSDTVARDLLYRYDSIRHFGDAQHGNEDAKSRARDPRNYIELQGLGRALVAHTETVVLIDEIDKAPRDLPNDLLRELDKGTFSIPEVPRDSGADASQAAIDPDNPLSYRHTMQGRGDARKPFVVITSNVERQLPDPFLRRCVFFHIRFPTEQQLRDILKGRFPDEQPLFLDNVVQVFEGLRKVPNLTKKPATSELINWVQVLAQVYERSSINAPVDQVATSVKNGGKTDFSQLPALSCLIKLREDNELLGFESVV